MKVSLDKLGGVGALLAAAACPVCFPKLALIGAVFGLGAFGAYEAEIFIAAQIFVGLALVGHAIAFIRHGRWSILALALGGAAAVFAGLYAVRSETLVYAGFTALVGASAAEVLLRRRRGAA